MDDKKKPVNLDDYDAEFIKSFLPVYLKEVDSSLSLITENFENKDFSNVKLYAHKIAGASKLIQAIDLSHYSSTIENQIIAGNHEVKQLIDELISCYKELKSYCEANFDIS